MTRLRRKAQLRGKPLFERLTSGHKVDPERSRFWSNLKRKSEYGVEFMQRQAQLEVNSNGMRKIYDPRMLIEITEPNVF